jgi:hypothetical protein
MIIRFEAKAQNGDFVGSSAADSWDGELLGLATKYGFDGTAYLPVAIKLAISSGPSRETPSTVDVEVLAIDRARLDGGAGALPRYLQTLAAPPEVTQFRFVAPLSDVLLSIKRLELALKHRGINNIDRFDVIDERQLPQEASTH